MNDDATSVPLSSLLAMTAEIVTAHTEANRIDMAELPVLIQNVYLALARANAPAASAETRQEPAVPIKRSIFPDYIVCLEDGRKLRMLRRHLNSTFGMTPEDYRKKWGLPYDYPMVAPAHAALRSTMAKNRGLGRRRVDEVEVTHIPEGKRGAPRKGAKQPAE